MDDRPRLSARLVAGLTLCLTASLMALRLGWIEPASPQIVPKGWGALPFAILLALGLAVLIGLAWANRRRWRAVLRPNRGRVLGALVLGFLTPMSIFDWVPAIIGGVSLMLGGAMLGEGRLDEGLFIFFWLLFALPWYPAACLIVSGIHGRAMRVAVFALMFWASYGALILAFGSVKFRL